MTVKYFIKKFNFKDVERLINEFKMFTIGISKLNDFNHLDFVAAKDLNRLVNKKILNLMNRYNWSILGEGCNKQWRDFWNIWTFFFVGLRSIYQKINPDDLLITTLLKPTTV